MRPVHQDIAAATLRQLRGWWRAQRRFEAMGTAHAHEKAKEDFQVREAKDLPNNETADATVRGGAERHAQWQRGTNRAETNVGQACVPKHPGKPDRVQRL